MSSWNWKRGNTHSRQCWRSSLLLPGDFLQVGREPVKPRPEVCFQQPSAGSGAQVAQGELRDAAEGLARRIPERSEGYSEKEIQYHIFLCVDAEHLIAEATSFQPTAAHRYFLLHRLTWEGRRELKRLRHKRGWNPERETVPR